MYKQYYAKEKSDRTCPCHMYSFTEKKVPTSFLVARVQVLDFRLPSILLKLIEKRSNLDEALETLLGTCLQASLEKFGSGLEGTQLTEELNKLLAMVWPTSIQCLRGLSARL